MAHPRGAKQSIVPIKGEKIESYVTFTPNLIPKSLKTHYFLNENSKFKTHPPKNAFLGLENTIFSKFHSRYAWDFTFHLTLVKFLGASVMKVKSKKRT